MHRFLQLVACSLHHLWRSHAGDLRLVHLQFVRFKFCVEYLGYNSSFLKLLRLVQPRRLEHRLVRVVLNVVELDLLGELVKLRRQLRRPSVVDLRRFLIRLCFWIAVIAIQDV